MEADTALFPAVRWNSKKASSYHSIVFVILIFDSFLKSNDVKDIRLEKVELSVGGFEFMHDSWTIEWTAP